MVDGLLLVANFDIILNSYKKYDFYTVDEALWDKGLFFTVFFLNQVTSSAQVSFIFKILAQLKEN